MPISAVIITLNEAKNIERCLWSLKNVADEIVVLDAFSTDKTEEICKAHGVKFIQRKWTNFSDSKNFANQEAQHDWILSLDADEALSEALQKEIIAEKEKLQGVYAFNRLTNYCGKWIYHCGWFPDWKVRLFNRKEANWEGEFVHEKLVFKSEIKIKKFKSKLFHYSYYQISEHWQRINRYTDLEAQNLFNRNKKANFFTLVFSPLVKFIKIYFFQKGFLDGYFGLIICVLTAYGRFLRYAKLYQIHQTKKNEQKASK